MFRPCIDLHEGKVKQIVGGTLGEAPGRLQTNFVSEHPAAWFANLYRRDGLNGGHIIMLGPGNEADHRRGREERAERAVRLQRGLQLRRGLHPQAAILG